MSDVKDEIDWEFPGAKTTEGQSNFFWQGVIRGLRSWKYGFGWIPHFLQIFFCSDWKIKRRDSRRPL